MVYGAGAVAVTVEGSGFDDCTSSFSRGTALGSSHVHVEGVLLFMYGSST